MSISLNDALQIPLDIDRRAAVVVFLEKNSGLSAISSADLELALKDEYDVIQADILDYIYKCNIVVSPDIIERCCIDGGKSEIVRARAFLYLGLRGRSSKLLSYSVSDLTEYERLFLSAGLCLSERRMTNLFELFKFLYSDDETIGKTAIELACSVVSDDEAELLRAVFSSLVEVRPEFLGAVEDAMAWFNSPDG